MRKNLWEYKSITSILEGAGMATGVDGVEGTIKWWRKEDDRPIIGVIMNVIGDLAQCEEDLKQRAAQIERDLTNMRRSLEEGHHINSSGVLQRGPVELDMLCLRRQQLVDHLKALLYVVKKDHERAAAVRP